MKLNFTYSDELYHYGVKGMKWGVRKQRTSSGKKRRSRIFMDDELVNQRHEELRKTDSKLKKLKKKMDSAEQDCLNALVNVNINPKGKKWRSLLDSYDTAVKAYDERDSELRDNAEKYAIQKGVDKTVDTTRKANKVGYEVNKVRLML